MEYLVVTLGGTIIACLLSAVAWRARPKPGSRPLVVITLAIAVWNASWVVAILAPSYAWQVVGSRLHFVGLTVIAPALLVLLLEYAGREELIGPKLLAVLAIEPIAANVLVWTSEYHDLFLDYAAVGTPAAAAASEIGVPGTGVVPTNFGPLFWAHAVYNWVFIAGCLCYVIWLATQRQDLYRAQLGMVGLAIFVPVTASVLDNLALAPIRLTEPAFVAFGAVATVAITRYDLIDVTPIARDAVLEDIDSAIFVLDRDDHVVDVNAAGRRLLDLPDESVVGRSAADVFAAAPGVYEHFEDVTSARETVTVDMPDGARHFDVRVSALEDAHGRLVGRVFLAHDVTAARERRERLERQNERLDEFASVVSHDLRNPLQVAAGRVELARRTDDDEAHLDAIERNHDRIEAIVDDVLALARQGETVTDTELVDIATVADDAWRSVDSGDAAFENDLRGRVEADRGRLRQVFENCFRNAVEHGSTGNQNAPRSGDAVEHGSTGGSGDAVTVRAGTLSADDGSVIDLSERGFFVEDDGPGIPESERETVFERGYTDAADGTGLGLSIVETIVEAHGWSIAVTNGDGPDDSGSADTEAADDRALSGARFTVTGVDIRDPDPDADAPTGETDASTDDADPPADEADRPTGDTDA